MKHVLWKEIYNSPGWISLLKCLTKTFNLKQVSDTSIFFVKLIGQWIPRDKGRGITRDILRTHLTKNLFKVGTLNKT